jgi:catalase
MIRFSVAGSIALVTGVLLLAAVAQEQPKQPVSTEQTQSYVPELAELMNITQTRFSRLSYAPETNNWQLAAYEAAHLRKSYEIAVKLYPVFREVQQKKLISDATEPALDLIDKAISRKNLSEFVKAIEVLRLTCNQCHIYAGVGFIRIGSPQKVLTGPQPN